MTVAFVLATDTNELIVLGTFVSVTFELRGVETGQIAE